MGSYAVIGLGRFGSSVARTLVKLGHEVLGIDKSEKKVQEMSNILTHVVAADSKNEEVLKSLGIRNFDAVVVAIGEDTEANILTTVLLTQLGVKNIIAKANTDIHGEVLKRVGATKIVHPEKDMGEKVANNMASGTILDYIELSPKHSIVEFAAPKKFVGKTLGKLNLRAKYGISVLAIKKGERIIVAPGADGLIEDKDLLVVVGENDKVKKCSKSN
ncbi:MAG: trk/ktr system potassium uptake protein [Clostridia bacterium]|jgi:trk system potassium uptake protein TrkA|nr:potassium transporter Trk [Clostridiales bacterium]MDK2986113.1 trk/ktr system potassium uptake protein [Clostridia bacterium]